MTELKMTLHRIIIYKVKSKDPNEPARFSWTRKSRNGKVVDTPHQSFASKYSAIESAVNNNPDIWQDMVKDATVDPIVPCTSKLVLRLPSRK